MPSRRTSASLLLLAALGLALGAGGCKAKPKAVPGGDSAPTLTSAGGPGPAVGVATPPAPVPADLKMAPLSFAPIAKSADPSVVTIYTTGEEEGRGLFGARHGRSHTSKGLGTGFIVDKEGVIITNNHVIEGADEITVLLSDEKRYPAKVTGRDPRTDIAVVKIDGAKDLKAIPLGDSDALEVGDWVVAIGNPFGLSHTVSAGIVSAKGRGGNDVRLDATGYYNFLQTDASINPGNSGGPLLNLRGEVVGMNTAIRGDGAQGIGFAIPINMVKQLMPPLLKDGKITRSALGVVIRDARDLSPEEHKQLKIEGEKGAVVQQIEPNGPADKAHVAVGDLIVGFEGQTIDRGSLLQWLASTKGVGQTANVRVMRSGKPVDLKVTLGELKEPKARPAQLRPRQQPQAEEPEDPFGGR
ncbi:MAG TPA: trypsin-like peptidase domain-containing protein [Labilithrix sp.]|nr:trypsin-like peptidase domain-containing protein [Labilithrix sp.]